MYLSLITLTLQMLLSQFVLPTCLLIDPIDTGTTVKGLEEVTVTLSIGTSMNFDITFI